MGGNENLIHEFVVECGEGLNQLDGDLVELEERPSDRDLLGRIFRTLHTIKGSCGFLNFARLGEMAHAGESLLGRIRDGKQKYDSKVADALLDFIDIARQGLESIRQTGQEGDFDFQSTAVVLKALALSPDVSVEGANLAGATSPEFSASVPEGLVRSAIALQADDTIDHASPSVVPPSLVPASPATESPEQGAPQNSVARVGEPAASISGPSAAALDVDPENALPSVPRDSGRTTATSGPTTAPSKSVGKRSTHSTGERVKPPEAGASDKPRSAPVPSARTKDEGSSGGLSSGNIRVDVHVLDELMNLVGELVLARNQILQHTATHKDSSLSTICQRLNVVTTDLQEGFMRTRMQRIGGMWQKFPRLVRDVAKTCQKKVKLEAHGAETELDKSLIEAISAPLTHVIRNAIDHGIEPPSLRRKRGKPEEGTITLRAYHEGGQVNIEVTDDGAGIDRERVRQKAVHLGLYSHDESINLPDEQLMDSIFMPGFSTATEVSEVSGRGVGMDVVKTQIEAIGGMVLVETRPNLGTTIRMKVPLTLAIIPALIVSCAEESFAIPQVNLLELVSLDAATAARSIETLHNTPVYRLRGNLLPLVSLRETLGLSPETDAENRSQERKVNIIVLRAIDRRFGLVVDAIRNNQEIVVKPLGPAVQGLGVYAGVTILGDGRVSLILDVLGLARISGALSQQPARNWAQPAETAAPLDIGESVLVCDAGGTRRIGIPLTSIERMDEFPGSAIEQSSGGPVLPYRGEILPLLDVGALVYGLEPSITTRDPFRVVICRPAGRRVGLVVDRVVDIAPAPRSARPSQHSVVESSSIIDGRATEVLGLEKLIEIREMATCTSD